MKAIYSHNQTFFDTLNSSSCYWAGFLAADGYIRSDTCKLICLVLARKDKKHIEKFKKAINATQPIRDFNSSNGYPSSGIAILRTEYCQNKLKQTYNFGQRKSLTLEPPNLKDENDIRAFIRGYMDGDGCITQQKTRSIPHWVLTFVGTAKMLQWIKYNIQRYVIDVGNPNINKDHNVFQLSFGCFQIKHILDWIYKDSYDDVRLDRKYQKYLEVLSFYEINKPHIAVSQYHGVCLDKRRNKWDICVEYNKKRHRITGFRTEREAALAYNSKARELGLLERCYDVT